MLNKIAALAVSFLCIIAADTFAAPIGAKAVFVEGDARVFSAKTAKETRIAVGSLFEEGDRIKTSRNGVVEVELDNGNLIRVDVDSDMTIRSLRRDEKGSTFSIFNLFIGRVKSAVSKLATADSKFEYHTKAAICGVGGTPPFVVEFRDNAVNVDLLGKPGDKGFVYVLGFDPAKTMVSLFAGTHTMARFGQAPLQPSPITAERLQRLNRTIPFNTRLKENGRGEGLDKGEQEKKEDKPEEKKEDKKDDKGLGGGKGPDKPGPGAGPPPPGTGENLALTTLSNNLSVPKQIGAANALTISGANSQTTSQQGAVGNETQSGSGAGSNAPPPIATFNINVKFR